MECMYGWMDVRIVDASELSDAMNEYVNTSSSTARVSWNRASREERVDDESPTRARGRRSSVDWSIDRGEI